LSPERSVKGNRARAMVPNSNTYRNRSTMSASE
jgi:hypothetical protein